MSTGWAVVVVRAWPDVGGVRARLFRTDEGVVVEEVVVASIDDATRTLARWLGQVEASGASASDDEIVETER